MQGKVLGVGALGLILVISGALGLNRWHQHRLEAERESANTPVLVALRGLNQGEALGPLDFRMRAWPSDAIPDGAITEPAGIEGRVLSASLQAGEPILLSKLAAVGALTGLVQRIAIGHRAISLKVNDANGVNGFIQPGHRVDLIAHLPASSAGSLANFARQGPAITRSLIDDVLVIAVDREAQTEQGRPKSSSVVTLEVKANDVERIEHTRQVGSISLALRADGDISASKTEGQTSASLWGKGSTPRSSQLVSPPVAPTQAQTVSVTVPDSVTVPNSATASVLSTVPILSTVPAKAPITEPQTTPSATAQRVALPLRCIEVLDGLRQRKECLP